MTKEIIENDPYKLAGVNIDAGEDLIKKIKKDVASTHGINVIGNIGGFAGMFRLPKELENPVLVACTDGVGTKVALAQEFGSLNGIGQDLVAMCVNDLVVCGAKPLFFLGLVAAYWDRLWCSLFTSLHETNGCILPQSIHKLLKSYPHKNKNTACIFIFL